MKKTAVKLAKERGMTKSRRMEAPLGISMTEVWPEAREVIQRSMQQAKKSREDERFFGQCTPAY